MRNSGFSHSFQLVVGNLQLTVASIKKQRLLSGSLCFLNSIKKKYSSERLAVQWFVLILAY